MDHAQGCGVTCGCTQCLIELSPHTLQPVAYRGPMHLLSNESAAVDHAVSELKYELSGIGCCHIPAVLRKLKRCPNVQHQPPAPLHACAHLLHAAPRTSLFSTLNLRCAACG